MNKQNYSTFYKALLLILLSTIVIMIIYTYTINTSIKKMQEDIQANNLNRLQQLMSDVDNNVDQLGMLAISLEINPKVRLLSSIDLMENYEQIKLRLELKEMINMNGFSQSWSNQISIYSHLIEKWIGSTGSRPPPNANQSSLLWHYDSANGYYIMHRKVEDSTIQITFPKSNLQGILDNAKIEGNDSFFLNKDNSVIVNKDTDMDTLNDLFSILTPYLDNQEKGTEIISIDQMEYMVNFIHSKNLDLYLIDYLPLNEALQPIAQTKLFVYLASASFFMTTIIILIYLYKKVQVPIVSMLKGVRKIKSGDYSYRIERVSHNEFDILYENFNDMAEEIEDLIVRVYREEVISRDAMIKKLQAQINPHFLYNCLFFISNMNRLGNDEAVESMTQNLAEYFRYSTRLDEPMTTLDKELEVVENYLTIQHLRMERLKFEINIPDSMHSIVIPKLFLQPLVENSVIHGIESKQGAGVIRITGGVNDNRYCIIVEDNGKGMSRKNIRKLLEQIKQPFDDTTGYALRNIQQRMSIHFVAPAGIEITQSALGGLCVTLYWAHNNFEGGVPYVSTNDRG